MLKFTDRGRGIERPWRRAIFGIVAALICCPRFLAQSEAGVGVEQIRQLVSEQRWQEIVTRLAAPHSPSADLDFYYGTALARLARWKEAEQVFKAGERLAPSDPRFPEELAGVAFKQRHYPQATRHLRRAIRLAPNNSYANDFLATVYFLEGNLEAAVKYWNRVGKPSILESDRKSVV